MFPRERVYIPLSCAATAHIRLRVQGELSPELLLELPDDEKSQAFLAQVDKCRQQGV